jgi:hypothetical protein
MDEVIDPPLGICDPCHERFYVLRAEQVGAMSPLTELVTKGLCALVLTAPADVNAITTIP